MSPARPLLPADPAGRARVRERMAWIDDRVFGPMVGVYYGTRADRIAAASDELAAALAALGDGSETGRGWPGRADPGRGRGRPALRAAGGLVRLGFDGPVDPRVAHHAERCSRAEGWSAVAWTEHRPTSWSAGSSGTGRPAPGAGHRD